MRRALSHGRRDASNERRLSPFEETMHKTHALAALVALASSGCTAAILKTPAWASESQTLAVQGYDGSKFTALKEQKIQIGSYAVENVDRDWDKTDKSGAGPWSRESKHKAYRFDLAAQGRTAHAECTEQAIEHSVAGFGKMKVTFGCTCKEGDVERFKAELVDGKGTATLGGSATYDVNSMHDSEQGARITKPLGYSMRALQGGEQSEVGVDVSGPGRAWVPTSATEDDLLGLVCGYAGFMLYQPTTF
jgi:hypothetical protein